MPVFAVNKDGVRFAMSFICGLSTMATFSVLLPPELPGDELPPHALRTTAPIAARQSATPSCNLRLMFLSSCFRQVADLTTSVVIRGFMLVVKSRARCSRRETQLRLPESKKNRCFVHWFACVYTARVVAPAPVSLGQAQLAEIARRGVPVPRYDRGGLTPRIVHIGVGGFHRAHLAVYMHELAAAGGDWGIVGLGLLGQDAKMAAALRAQDNLYALIEKGDGEPTAAVVGSIIGYVLAVDGHEPAVADLIASPTTSILSLTITEAGYAEPPATDRPATFHPIAPALAGRPGRRLGPPAGLSCDHA